LFGRSENKQRWKVEYDDTIYKIYDWEENLAGYFFPHYGDIEAQEQKDEIVEDLTKMHAAIPEGTLLLPMVKLNLLDNHKGMDIDYVISSLEANVERAGIWKRWLQDNANAFGIVHAAIHTAREDRNMLSIALGIVASIRLGEKEVRSSLSPLLDKLSKDGLL